MDFLSERTIVIFIIVVGMVYAYKKIKNISISPNLGKFSAMSFAIWLFFMYLYGETFFWVPFNNWLSRHGIPPILFWGSLALLGAYYFGKKILRK